MKRFSFLLLAFCLFCVAGRAFDVNYKPSAESAIKMWGTDKSDTYDVAVYLNDPSLVGRNITGFTVPLTSSGVQNISGWLTKKLTLKKVGGVNGNYPDIVSQEADVADGVLSVTFAEPYTLTSDGVYVGYSFQVENASDAEGKKPVACYAGVNSDALWVHTRKTHFQWTSLSADAGCVSAINVQIEGALEPHALGVKQAFETYAAEGDSLYVDVLISNHGSSPVSSFTYQYSIAGGQPQEATFALSEPLPPLYMATRQVTLPMAPAPSRGEYQGQLAITHVDGVANGESNTCEFPLYVLSFKPHKTVVMEELTGTWCGWCPRGLACMEHMANDYPDSFLAIAYHSDDEMTTNAGDPVNSSQLPYCALDRSYRGDPGYPNILPLFQEMVKVRPIANISVEAALGGEKITCASTVTFARSLTKANYRVAYMLLADGLHSPTWYQSNSYSGLQERAEQDSYLQYFIDSPKVIPNMLYKDVMVFCKDIKGITGSVPADITGDTPLSHTFVINLSDVVDRVGNSLMQADATYRIAALLIDSTTGLIVNAAQCPVSGLTGVESVETSKPHEAQYYDLMGRRLTNPSKGSLYIKVENGKGQLMR